MNSSRWLVPRKCYRKSIRTICKLNTKPVDSKMIQWEGVVGLEVHAQLKCNSKLFSPASTLFGGFVNNQVSLFDAAIPGTMPVLNRECVKKAVAAAVALNCEVHSISWFDRKHYFYADLPAGYQITQQRLPLATNGHLEFCCFEDVEKYDKPYMKCSKIKQIQLEQDSGKSLHDTRGNMSLVDLNRAGSPLIEIVFEPDLKNGDEAACLIKELMLILKALDICSCKISEGALRVDANISVRPIGNTALGVRTEVKNIGGILSLKNAIDFEILRQSRMLKYGKNIINETRSWDSTQNKTIVMRDKEVQQDYRFMPEPNLPPLHLIDNDFDFNENFVNVAHIRKQIPELPASHRAKLKEKYDLPFTLILRLLVEPKLLHYFEKLLEEKSERPLNKVCDILLIDLKGALNKNGMIVDECKMDDRHLSELFDIIQVKKINRIIYNRLFDIFINGSEKSPSEIIKENNWYKINDENILSEGCKLTIEYNPEMVQLYYRAKNKVKKRYFQELLNETIKHTDERADLIMLKEILNKLLQEHEQDYRK